MDELEQLRQENRILRKRVKYLEAALSDIDKSSALEQNIEQCRRAITVSSLINTVAGSQKLNIADRQQILGQMSIEKIELDVKIEEAIRNVSQNSSNEDDFAEWFNYKEVQGGIKIQGCHKSCKELVIPSMIKGKTVVEIGEAAFRNMKFRKVRIPDDVRYINRNAFENCKNLREIILPQNLIFWGHVLLGKPD